MILKNRAKIEAAYAVSEFESARKRMRTVNNESVEIPLMQGIKEGRRAS